MAEVEFTAAALAAELKALGDDSPSVAKSLADKGCLGVRDSCAACPVAEFIRLAFPKAKFVDVLQTAIYVEREVWVVDGGYGEWVDERIHIEPPDPVADFMGDFDARRYPHLIKEAA